MKRGLFRLLVLFGVFHITLFLVEGCGVATAIGTTTTIASDRRQDRIVVLDRSTQLNAKSVVNRILHSRGNVGITVYNRTALLTGQVLSRDDKLRIERAVSHVKNVHKLVSELTISPETTIMQRAKDSKLTDIVSSHLSEVGGRFSYVTRIITENDVVYVMGIVTREEANEILSCIRNVEGVEKVVEVLDIVSQETANFLDARYMSGIKKNEKILVS